MHAIRSSLTFGAVILAFYLLLIGKSFFIPLVIAIVIWYLIMILSEEFRRIHLGKKKLPRYFSIPLSIIVIALVIYGVISLVNSSVDNVVEMAPFYQERFQELINLVYAKFDIKEFPSIANMLKSFDLPSLISAITGMIATIAGYTGMIIVYVILLLLEFPTFDKKLNALSSQKKDKNGLKVMIGQINKDIRTYLKIKTLASILTAVLSYIVLVIVGVDFAIFWALLIFLLNYIPTFGSIIAVLFPVLLVLIQFGDFGIFAVTGILLILIQFSIGNILEPKFMGKSINLSPLVIIISLIIWGEIWGVLGMFLAVPLMVIINIILAKFESTKGLAIMLSSDGEVK